MPKEQRRVTIESLNRSRRGLTAFMGVSGLGAGVVAVFKSANQAGTVALLTIGALASVFALLGKIPLRWIVAGAELDMSYDERQETADALSEVLTADQLRLLTRRLLEEGAENSTSTGRLQLAATLSRASNVEDEGHSRMRRFGTLSDVWSYEPASQVGGDLGADGFMTATDGTRIAIDFKAWGEVSKQRRHQLVTNLTARLPAVLERTNSQGLLVLTDESQMTDELGEFPSVLRRPMRVVTSTDSFQFVESKMNELRQRALSD
jgi:hypothetical protein